MVFNKKLVWPLLLLLIGVLVAVLNFKPGLWLSGWDTLHPEFDFGLNLSRQLFGVWRGDQGVGALSAHAHMSELPRTIILWLLNIFIPLESVRYVFVLLCLILGPLGVYFFVWDGLYKQKNSGITAGIIAGLFYLFNPFVIQHFIVPFEMFQVQYAAVGWLFWLGLRAFRSELYKNYAWFFIVAFLSSSQAYASQLWWVFASSFGLFLFGLAIFSKHMKMAFLKVIKIIAIMLVANAYWLLPNMYFIFEGSQVPKLALINQLFSADSFLKNREFGTLNNLVKMKNFLFDWDLLGNKADFVPVMSHWSSWLDQSGVVLIYWIIFSVVIFGLIKGTINKKRDYRVAVSLLLLIGLVTGSALLTNTPLVRNTYDWLRDRSSLLEEGFRTPFTKVSIVYLLVYAAGFGFGTSIIIEYVTKKIGKIRNWARIILIILVAGSLMYGVKPIFQGKLIADELKLEIPQEYFNLFKYMNTQPDQGRIALMPMLSKWGWEYHDWGYQGPGFLWFGLKQPLLTRDFDRWSPYNENFYRQAELAVAKGDADSFQKTLRQYGVRWLIVDTSLIDPGMNDEAKMTYQLTSETIVNNGYTKIWSEGSLVIYDTKIRVEDLWTPESWDAFGLGGNYMHQDLIYGNNQVVNYIETFNEGNIYRLDSRNNVKLYDLKEDIVAVESWGEDRGFVDVKNCDRLQRGSVERRFLFQGRLYQAFNGAAVCDFFDYPNLDSNRSYVLHIKSVNETGRPIKVSVNQFNSYRTVTEYLLDPKEVDHWIAVDGLVPGENGLVVNVETRSFGEIESVNRLDSIEFYMVPLEYGMINGQTESKTDSLAVISTKKWGTGVYIAKVEGEGLLVLNQGFDKGWVGVRRPDSGFKIYDLRILEHVKVNGWANGWMISGNEDGSVMIFYWPQILEWIGLASLVYCIIWIVKK